MQNIPSMSLDFDLGLEQPEMSPMHASPSIGFGISSLEEGSGAADGQGIALVVDAEVSSPNITWAMLVQTLSA